MADLEYFIQAASEEDLYVILRPGPYICAERDMGGFPYWILNKYPKIKLRTYDSDYVEEVTKWYSELMPKMNKYLYGNGGPIIMVQVENEYGAFLTNDREYMHWLKNLTLDYVEENAVIFTNDNPFLTARSHIKDVLATLDFGPGSKLVVDGYWQALRVWMKKGPLVNIEYYPGWYTPWQGEMGRKETQPVLKTLRYMLQKKASVNFYMFFGGTNFGFTAGANGGGPGTLDLVVDVTSYDYDAPMDEAGDPTPKLLEIRDVIGEFLPLPGIPIPEKTPKVKFGPVVLTKITELWSDNARARLSEGNVENQRPLSFEALDQYSGLVLYETELPKIKRDPVNLVLEIIHDRGYVFIDRVSQIV